MKALAEWWHGEPGFSPWPLRYALLALVLVFLALGFTLDQRWWIAEIIPIVAFVAFGLAPY